MSEFEGKGPQNDREGDDGVEDIWTIECEYFVFLSDQDHSIS